MSAPDSSGQLLYYAHATLCLLLAGGLSWQSLRMARGPRRLLRLLAGLLAAAALWLTAYPPRHTVRTTTAATALLLTPGYSPDSVKALRRRLGSALIFSYRPPTVPTADTLPLTSLPSLVARRPELHQLHVFGQGIPVADLPALPAGLQIIAHPGVERPSFKTGAWNRQLTMGEALQVRGTFNASTMSGVWVRLLVAGAVRDSTRLSAGRGSFTLRYVPRQPGQLLARLEARRGGVLLAAEPVPATVRPARALRLLLLAGTPSFELNLLKNHLAERGHQVALRLNLSRGLQQTAVQNRPSLDLTRLTPTLLRSFDAVVTDVEALNTLTATETRALSAATADGLGFVLTSATELPRSLPGRSDFHLLPRPPGGPERPQTIRWSTGQASAILAATLKPGSSAQALIAGPAPGTAAAATRRTGWGTVVVAMPTSTFQWLLSGQSATYDSYWSTLLTAAARPLETAAQWSTPAWPRLDEPQLLQLRTAQPPRAQVRAEAASVTPLALQQHPQRSDVWQATYWPAQAGWHRVLAPGQDTTAFYVFAPADWLGPMQDQRIAAVYQRSRSATLGLQPTSEHSEAWLPAGWYFALFVLAAGGLWLDEKR